jgi:hypothetical protein
MPGPGQGKHSQKKKWRENTFNLDANIAAVDTIIMASNTTALKAKTSTLTMSSPSTVTTAAESTDERTQESSHAATKPTTATTTANAATAAPSPDTSSFTYSHEEVQQLLEDARLDGWEEGYEEGSKRLMEGYRDGYEARWKLDQEKGEQARKKGLLEGYELGIQEGKEHERRKWLTEGHGTGLCLSMAAHACALFRGTIILEEAETQTDAAPTTSINVQTSPAPDRQCAALQTEPPDDKDPNPAITTPIACPNSPADVTMSPPTVVQTPVASTSKTETRAVSEAQTATSTCTSDETTSHAIHCLQQ